MKLVRNFTGKNARPAIGSFGLSYFLDLSGQNQIDERAVDWRRQNPHARVYANGALVDVDERVTQPMDVSGD